MCSWQESEPCDEVKDVKLPDLKRFLRAEPVRQPVLDSKPIGPPTFGDLQTSDFTVHVAIEVWRLRRRADRLAHDVGEDAMKGVRDSVRRLDDLLARYQVEALDHSGEPYHEGLRLDILHVDGESKPDRPLRVLETVRPTVQVAGRVLTTGQVILGAALDEGAPE